MSAHGSADPSAAPSAQAAPDPPLPEFVPPPQWVLDSLPPEELSSKARSYPLPATRYPLPMHPLPTRLTALPAALPARSPSRRFSNGGLSPHMLP